MICVTCDKKDKEVALSVKQKPVVQNMVENNMSLRRKLPKNGVKNGEQSSNFEQKSDDPENKFSMKEEKIELDSDSPMSEPPKSRKKVEVDHSVNFYKTVAPDIMLGIIDKMLILENTYGLQLLGEFNEQNLENSEENEIDKMEIEEKI